MLEQLESLYVHPAKLIRLRFRYKLPNRQTKVQIYSLEVKYLESRQVNVYKFLTSVMEDLLSPILIMQNSMVFWETVSLIYPHNHKYNLLQLPLTNVRGLISDEHCLNNLKTMVVSIRFEGRPLPTNNKFYGINNADFSGQVTRRCGLIYTEQHFIEDTGVAYGVVFPTNLPIQISKDNKSKTNKRATRVFIQKPIMAFTNFY